MNIDTYLPSGVTVDDLLILMSALSAGSVAITIWFTLLQRDPALRRAKVIAAQRSAMRNTLVGPRRRQQRLPTLGMMRQVVDRLNLLKSGQAERISHKLMRAGWRSKDAIIRYLFMKLFLPLFFGVIVVILLSIGAAIASYQRSLLSANSAFDRRVYGGDERAMTVEAMAGMELFRGRAGCSACHLIGENHALFTDNDFHDTGIGWANRYLRPLDRGPVAVEISPGVKVPVDRDVVDSVGLPAAPDLGRHEVTLDPADLWRIHTPSLRNVALTAPYMHDGSLRTLEEVVRFYDRGGYWHAGLDPLIKPLDLSDREIASLVVFVQSLTGDNVAALIADARSAAVGN